jgi:lipoprotein-anchoring transpeptidase ErfK/SrfK
MRPGDKLAVPMAAQSAASGKARRLHVNLTEKTIRVIGERGQLIGLFHCSVAASKAKLPRTEATVANIAPNPTYVFDPRMWPEVKETITQKLTIPPGPRNPVGRCWIGLSLPGYGMHGTPNPELIGKTGSHGCFRLTNWDALRLSRMVQVGTPVEFEGHPDLAVASSGR